MKIIFEFNLFYQIGIYNFNCIEKDRYYYFMPSSTWNVGKESSKKDVENFVVIFKVLKQLTNSPKTAVKKKQIGFKP